MWAEDRLLRLDRLFLLDGLVHRVVGGTPVRSYAVVLHERLAHGASDLYHLLLEERGSRTATRSRGTSCASRLKKATMAAISGTGTMRAYSSRA